MTWISTYQKANYPSHAQGRAGLLQIGSDVDDASICCRMSLRYCSSTVDTF